MIKVKTFANSLKIFHAKKELEALDDTVNRFMEENTQLPEPHHTFFDVLGIKPPIENLLTDELISKLSKAREFAHSLA